MLTILLIPILATFGESFFPVCECAERTETFLPYAKEDLGLPLYVEILSEKAYRKESAQPIRYLELKVLQNLSSIEVNDTINLVVGGGKDCTDRLIADQIGSRSVIRALDWDESKYGYQADELEILFLSTCMVSNIPVINHHAFGPITEKGAQRMHIDQLIGEFVE